MPLESFRKYHQLLIGQMMSADHWPNDVSFSSAHFFGKPDPTKVKINRKKLKLCLLTAKRKCSQEAALSLVIIKGCYLVTVSCEGRFKIEDVMMI